jgi:hypothetical protein
LTAKEENLGKFASKLEEQDPSPGKPASGCSEGVSPWDPGDYIVEASAPEDIFFFFNNNEEMIAASYLQNLMNTNEQLQNLIECTFAKPHRAAHPTYHMAVNCRWLWGGNTTTPEPWGIML